MSVTFPFLPPPLTPRVPLVPALDRPSSRLQVKALWTGLKDALPAHIPPTDGCPGDSFFTRTTVATSAVRRIAAIRVVVAIVTPAETK